MQNSYTISYSIGAYEGAGFKGMPLTRDYTIKFVGTWPASKVIVNDVTIPYSVEDTKSIKDMYPQSDLVKNV